MPATVYIKAESLPTPLVDTALMREVGDLVTSMIRTRTQQGRDATGASFVPYTPDYAAKKAKEGLGTTPNLTVSGRMLNDMGITDVAPGKVSIGFRSAGGSTRGKGLTLIQRSRAVGAEDKARYHDVLGAGKSRTLRKFLGLTREETETVRARVARYLDEIVRRANNR